MSHISYIGRQTPQSRILAGITQYTYDNRGLLRTSVLPANGDLAFVEGLGLFQFFANTVETDDDETCFVKGTGCWLLVLISWEFMDAQILSVSALVDDNQATATVNQTENDRRLRFLESNYYLGTF